MKRVLLICMVLLLMFNYSYSVHSESRPEFVIQPHDERLYDYTVTHEQEEKPFYHPPIDSTKNDPNFFEQDLSVSVDSGADTSSQNPISVMSMITNKSSHDMPIKDIDPLLEDSFYTSERVTVPAVAALENNGKGLSIQSSALNVLAEASSDVADTVFEDFQDNGTHQTGEVYQKAVDLIRDAWVRQREFAIDSDKLIDSSLELRKANALSEPERSNRLKQLVNQLQVLMQKAEIEQKAEDNVIVQKARLISEPLADVVKNILEQQREIWAMAIASVHRSEIAIQVFINHQEDIVKILKKDTDKDIVLAKLRSLNEQLQIVMEAFFSAEKVKDKDLAIDLVTLNLLKERFGEAVYARAVSMNEYFKNLPYQFTENFLRLLVRKQLKIVIDKDDLHASDVLGTFDLLEEQIKQEQAARLSQLYAARISAMDFAVRINYMRIIQQAIMFASANDFSEEQKDLFEVIKQDIINQNSQKLDVDLHKLDDSTKSIGSHLVAYGTAEQQAALLNHLNILRDGLIFSDDQEQIKKENLFNELYNELYALGAAADPFLMGLLMTPETFEVSLEKRFLEKLNIILGEYQFEVRNGDKNHDTIISLNKTVEEFKKLLEPRIASFEDQFVKDNHPFTEFMEKAADVEADFIKAQELKIMMHSYIEKQDSLMVHFATLRSQAVHLLKDAEPSQALITDFSSTVDKLYAQIVGSKSSNNDYAQKIADLKILNKSIMQKLSHRLVLLQELPQAQAVIEEIAAVQRKIQEIQQELQLLETYDVEKCSFNNDQIIEYYGQIALLLNGKPFDLLYGVKDESLESKLDEKMISQARLDETVIFLNTEEEDQSIDTCLKLLEQANHISRDFNNLNLLVTQLFVKVTDAVGRIERIKSNLNYSSSNGIIESSFLNSVNQDFESYRQRFVDNDSSLKVLQKKCDNKMCYIVKKVVSQLIKLAQGLQDQFKVISENIKFIASFSV